MRPCTPVYEVRLPSPHDSAGRPRRPSRPLYGDAGMNLVDHYRRYEADPETMLAVAGIVSAWEHNIKPPDDMLSVLAARLAAEGRPPVRLVGTLLGLLGQAVYEVERCGGVPVVEWVRAVSGNRLRADGRDPG